MANVSRFDDEDHVFGDVGGVIADPFELAGNEDEIDAGLDDALIAEHISQQLAKNLIFQRVQPVILPEHVLRQAGVHRHECVERLAQRLQRQDAHAGNVNQWFDGRVLKIPLPCFPNVVRDVAHALEAT